MTSTPRWTLSLCKGKPRWTLPCHVALDSNRREMKAWSEPRSCWVDKACGPLHRGCTKETRGFFMKDVQRSNARTKWTLTHGETHKIRVSVSSHPRGLRARIRQLTRVIHLEILPEPQVLNNSGPLSPLAKQLVPQPWEMLLNITLKGLVGKVFKNTERQWSLRMQE